MLRPRIFALRVAVHFYFKRKRRKGEIVLASRRL